MLTTNCDVTGMFDNLLCQQLLDSIQVLDLRVSTITSFRQTLDVKLLNFLQILSDLYIKHTLTQHTRIVSYFIKRFDPLIDNTTVNRWILFIKKHGLYHK